jgi:hypothetical protein
MNPLALAPSLLLKEVRLPLTDTVLVKLPKRCDSLLLQCFDK